MSASIYQFSITPDCRFLNMKVIGNPGNATATFFNNGEQVYEYNFVMLDNDDIDNTVQTPINIPLANIFKPNVSDPGILTVDVFDGSSQEGSTDFGDPGHATKGILVSCDLDCCLAKKVLALTGCDCNSKCDKELAESQKLFLYIQAIKTLLGQTGLDLSLNASIFEQAIEIHKDAKQLCLTNCGCNC